MPTWLKVVLIVVAVVVLCGAATVGGVYWWWQNNGAAMIAGARATIAEGVRFGTGKERTACVDEAVVRAKGAGFTEGVKARLFLGNCLKAAKPTPGFCADLPAKLDILTSVSWQNELNQRYGLTPPFETSVLGEIQNFCESQTGK